MLSATSHARLSQAAEPKDFELILTRMIREVKFYGEAVSPACCIINPKLTFCAAKLLTIVLYVDSTSLCLSGGLDRLSAFQIHRQQTTRVHGNCMPPIHHRHLYLPRGSFGPLTLRSFRFLPSFPQCPKTQSYRSISPTLRTSSPSSPSSPRLPRFPYLSRCFPSRSRSGNSRSRREY